MHICLISEEYPPETGWGGIGTYTYNLANGLVEEGHDVTVIAGALKEDAKYIENSVKVHRVARKNLKNIFLNFLLKKLVIIVFPRTLSYIEWSFRTAKKVAEINTLRKIDVIEAPETNAPAFFLTFFSKIPLIIKLHTPYEIHCKLNGVPVNFDLKLVSFFERIALKRAARVTSCSRAIVTYLKENRYLKIKDVTVVPNPIDESNFTPDTARNTEEDKEKLLLFVGRIEQRKGVDTLFEAFQKVWNERRDVRLQLVGGDKLRFFNGKFIPYSEYLKGKAHDSEVLKHVDFVGKLNRSKLVNFYRQADICIFPSTVFENFSYTCLEAMACGTPVIASNCGGFPEMIENNVSGLLVQPLQSGELAKTIIYLLENPSLRDKMGAEARKRVVGLFAIKKIVRRNLSVYGEVINRESRNTESI